MKQGDIWQTTYDVYFDDNHILATEYHEECLRSIDARIIDGANPNDFYVIVNTQTAFHFNLDELQQYIKEQE